MCLIVLLRHAKLPRRHDNTAHVTRHVTSANENRIDRGARLSWDAAPERRRPLAMRGPPVRSALLWLSITLNSHVRAARPTFTLKASDGLRGALLFGVGDLVAQQIELYSILS